MKVAILLPLIVPFTRMIERIVPERGIRLLDLLIPHHLRLPSSPWRLAVEQWPACGALCSSATDRLEHLQVGGRVYHRQCDAASDIGCIARDARVSFTRDRSPSDEEQRWFISTLHALDHTIRLADATKENVKIGPDGVDERRAVALCAKAMRSASSIATLLIHAPLPESEEPGHTEQSAMFSVGPADTDATPLYRSIRQSYASNTVRLNWPNCCRYIAVQRSSRSRPAR